MYQTRRLVEQDHYQPVEEMALQRFHGERFEVFGELLSARQD